MVSSFSVSGAQPGFSTMRRKESTKANREKKERKSETEKRQKREVGSYKSATATTFSSSIRQTLNIHAEKEM